jgi:hypothetical protein
MPQAYAPLGRLAMTGLGTVDAEMPQQADLMAPVTATTTAAASHFDSPPEGGRSARTSDGNHDGNNGSHQRPDATANSHVLLHIRRELGIRYT